jgi:hypothetical protein
MYNENSVKVSKREIPMKQNQSEQISIVIFI